MTNKIKEIIKRREFTSFWEVFDFMVNASYTELEAMKMGLEVFDGKIWDKVINAAWVTGKNEIVFTSGYTTTFSTSGTVFGVDPCGSLDDPDELMVEIYIMTKEANPLYLPIYKSYVETRNYSPEPELDKHIKSISIKLKTDLAINLFKDGCKKLT